MDDGMVSFFLAYKDKPTEVTSFLTFSLQSSIDSFVV